MQSPRAIFFSFIAWYLILPLAGVSVGYLISQATWPALQTILMIVGFVGGVAAAIKISYLAGSLVVLVWALVGATLACLVSGLTTRMGLTTEPGNVALILAGLIIGVLAALARVIRKGKLPNPEATEAAKPDEVE